MSLTLPLKNPIVTQSFWNDLIVNWKHFYAQFWLKWHNGIDYRAKVWTPLYASLDWIVESKDTWTAGYWKHIYIRKTRTDWISEVVYGHLSKQEVFTSHIVKAGDLIGYSGNTGDSLAPHLHFWLRFKDLQGNVLDKGNWYGGYVDPTKYFV